MGLFERLRDMFHRKDNAPAPNTGESVTQAETMTTVTTTTVLPAPTMPQPTVPQPTVPQSDSNFFWPDDESAEQKPTEEPAEEPTPQQSADTQDEQTSADTQSSATQSSGTPSSAEASSAAQSSTTSDAATPSSNTPTPAPATPTPAPRHPFSILTDSPFAAPSASGAGHPTPAPLLPADEIAAAREAIGKIEKHDLSDEQISAIAGAGHNTLVLAGAGTGKTTVIAGYVAWLLATGRATPDEILVLSFTKKSADDMSERINQAVRSATKATKTATPPQVHASTFHSLGLGICTKSSLAKPHVLTSGEITKNIINPTVESLLSDPRTYPKFLGLYLDYLESGKNKGKGKGSASASSASAGRDTDSDDASSPDAGTTRLTKGHPFLTELKSTIGTVITQMRAQGLDVTDLARLNERDGGDHVGRNRKLLTILSPVWTAYQEYLHQHNAIDFPGMITQAIDAIRSDSYRHPYKYVLIDEYQDMSLPRYALIRAMREQSDFSLFCVGDDWQSIYRFAGSDIRLTLDFQDVWKEWGPTTLRELTVTRRFGQSLIDASDDFVMRDPDLYRKHLRPAKPTKSDHSLKVLGGHGEEKVYDALVTQLRAFREKAPTVLLLGRYNSDLDVIKRLDAGRGLFAFHADGGVEFRERPGMRIDFMTVHRSKGLQADYAFLLCCTGGTHGFPSTIPPEPLVGLLLPEAERMPDAEERRLFYVAMTRCRKKVFFLLNSDRPSRFMYEMCEAVPNIFRQVALPERCPVCGEAITKRFTRRDPTRWFWGCTNYPLCSYTRWPADEQRKYEARQRRRMKW